jgi:hypothetical protein
MSETVMDKEDILHVLEGFEDKGSVNTTDDDLLANVRHSIRLGYPQVRPEAPKGDRVCIVGGGPSLADTFHELRDLYFDGAKVITVNGSAAWCLERNIRPSGHIVLDARASNARFVNPPIPRCKYFLASQCHPETWAAVEGRPDVFIWHAAVKGNPTVGKLLNEFYQDMWMETPGGTTVVMRALAILAGAGFRRFDLFGVDSCFMGNAHHAYEQPENAGDQPYEITVSPTGHPDLGRKFICAGWHVKQLECFLQTVRVNGHNFLLNVHGDGLLAYALKSSASAECSIQAAAITGAQEGS